VGVLNVMLVNIMHGIDRFTINQRSGYIAICEAIISIPCILFVNYFQKKME